MRSRDSILLLMIENNANPAAAQQGGRDHCCNCTVVLLRPLGGNNVLDSIGPLPQLWGLAGIQSCPINMLL